MTKVINLFEKIKAKKQATGEQDFMLCSCQNPYEPCVGYVPVIIHDASGEFISALVCANCESEIKLVNGRPIT